MKSRTSSKTKTTDNLAKEIYKIMSDGNTRHIAEIKVELDKSGFVLNRDYNEDHLSSALRRLKRHGYIKNVRRGVYVYFKNFTILRNKIQCNLKRDYVQIFTALSNVDGLTVMEMDEHEKESFDAIAKIKSILEKLIEM